MMWQSEQLVDFLLFEVSSQRFALPVECVRELLRAVTSVALPQAPEVVEGVVNIRGQLVPVLDIRSRFGLAAKAIATSDCLIVACARERLVALRVDRAVQLLQIEGTCVEPGTALRPGSPYVAGVAKLPDGLLLIHDVTTFLTAVEDTAIDQAVRCCERDGALDA